jgi:PrgI family protein
MQYQVPQFIDTEDKVVGPFSLRQFAYVGVAALVSALAYFLLQPWLAIIIAIILIGGSLALSFIKINGRPLIKIATAAVNFYWKPQTYIWKPDHPVAPQRHAAPALRELAPIAVKRPAQKPVRTIKEIAEGGALHRSWQNLQTGTRPAGKPQSSAQFLEKKMEERYQIFQRQSGERQAARRVDYR